MATKKSIINLVYNFAHDVQKEGVRLEKAILFGSYAKNTATKYSDIDIALVSNDFEGLLLKDLDLFIKAKIKKPYSRIQIQTFSTSYFKKGDPFIDEIKRTGLEIKL